MFHDQREQLEQLTKGLGHRGPQDTGQNTARLQQDIIPFLAKYIAQKRTDAAVWFFRKATSSASVIFSS